MYFDERAFDQTARAVWVMNPAAKEQYPSWEDVKEFMISMAYTYGPQGTTSFSTGGFQLSFYKTTVDATDGLGVTASVSAHTAINYYEKMRLIESALVEIISQIHQGGESGKVFARDACIERAKEVLNFRVYKGVAIMDGVDHG